MHAEKACKVFEMLRDSLQFLGKSLNSLAYEWNSLISQLETKYSYKFTRNSWWMDRAKNIVDYEHVLLSNDLE